MCDLNTARLKHLKSLYPEVGHDTSYDHMLNGINLDAVVIATGVNAHFPMAKASLEAGKHTFIEKPMASSVEQCEELVDLARKKGVILMTGHTFLYSPVVRKIKEIIDKGDIGENPLHLRAPAQSWLVPKDINVAWDLAPHDLSIILSLIGEMPETVNCRGSAHVTPGIEDVTTMCLGFSKQRSATIQSSWLDPRKVREMTIVGSKRMIVYDDLAPLEKIRVFDMRVERPPHYDTFGEFQYAYHYGDMYAPYIKQEEPLKTECQHFLDCIRNGATPITCGERGLELVKILEASSESLRQGGAPVEFSKLDHFVRNHAATAVARGLRVTPPSFCRMVMPAPRNVRRGPAKRRSRLS